METPVVELIKGLIQVRDGLGLIAFLSLIFLLAFRTKKVPELLFGLLRDKLTRQQFAALLHRFMTLGFAAFLTLTALTLASQVLSSRTQPSVPNETVFLNELTRLKEATDKKFLAEAEYRAATDLLNQNQLAEAVLKLNQSIAAVPTLAAHETLIYVYVLIGDFTNADKAREAALKIAQGRGDTLAQVRLQRNDVPVQQPPLPVTIRIRDKVDPAPEPVKPDKLDEPTPAPIPPDPPLLVDGRLPLPRGGGDLKSSVAIEPGRYICTNQIGCDFSWFNISLQLGQEVEFMVRGPQNGENSYPRMEIFNENGSGLPKGYVGDISIGETFTRIVKIPESKVYFIQIKTENNAILDILVR
jgi:hypothetical protein